ncbi:RagB/SusD family nutrient uptake outer membrane protein [Bacteroidota bacterium]
MKNIQYILLLIISVSLFSCSDFLNEDPYYVVTTDNAISTLDKAKAAVGSSYATLEGDAWGGGLYVAQASKSGFVNWRIADYEMSYSQTENAPGVANYWKAFYTTLNRANFAIYGIPRLDESLVGDGTERDALLAEARCLRAWAHINILWNFGHWWADDSDEFGLLYHDEMSDLSNIVKERINVGDSYKYILEDLDFAIENLKSYSTPKYISVEFAKALKAKILLYRGAYNNVNDIPALTEALGLINEVLSSSAAGLGMSENLKSVFDESWNSTENLFTNYLGDYSQGKRGPASGEYYRNTVIGNGDGKPYPAAADRTAGLNYGVDLFKADPRWNVVTGYCWGSTGKAWSWSKVSRVASAAQGGTYEDYASYYLRYAELYIMKAELLARTGASISEAIAPINTMRSKRTNPVLSDLNPTTNEELMDAIFYEYFFETFLENGSEFFASLRFHKNGAQWIETIKGEGLIENKLCWPIPNEEMITNELMKQNPDLN